MTATHNRNVTTTTDVLYLAFELGDTDWKLAFTIGLGQKPRLRSMPARDLPRLQEEIAKAKQRFQLAADAPVRSCYEAGRDGFWLDRYLSAGGIQNSGAVRRAHPSQDIARLDTVAFIHQKLLDASGDRGLDFDAVQRLDCARRFDRVRDGTQGGLDHLGVLSRTFMAGALLPLEERAPSGEEDHDQSNDFFSHV